MSKRKVGVNVSLDIQLVDELDNLSGRIGTTFSELVNRAVKNYYGKNDMGENMKEENQRLKKTIKKLQKELREQGDKLQKAEK